MQFLQIFGVPFWHDPRDARQAGPEPAAEALFFVFPFDEISLGLAPIVINDIYAALADIISDNISAIVVEQDTSRALSVSDRTYCLQEGRVSLEGVSDSLSREAINQAYFGL